MTTSTELDTQVALAQAEWAHAERALLTNGTRTLLYGPSGTGKSYAGIRTAQSHVYRQYLTIDTPASEPRGHFVPSETGGFRWHDGPGVLAWRTGGRFCIEEIDQASGDCLTFLLGLLDDPESASLTLPSNESITPASGFSVVATTNEVPTVLSAALLDRFDAVVQITKPNPQAFDPMYWHNPELAIAAACATYLSRNTTRQGPGGRPIGLRAYKSIDRFQSSGLTLEQSADIVLGQGNTAWFLTSLTLASPRQA